MNLEALRALEKAVEAGKFSRPNNGPPRFTDFTHDCRKAGILGKDAIDALKKGKAGEFIRVLIAQAEAKGVGE